MHSPDTILNLYQVSRDGETCVIRPSGLFAGLMVAGFAGGSAFCVYPAVLFLQRADDAIALGFTGIFLSAAVLMAALAVRAWHTRRTPLTIDPSGSVYYGDLEICAAGTVRAVRIVPTRGGDPGECDVCFEQADGILVSLPTQYFPGFSTEDLARPLAAALASALDVHVRDSDIIAAP